MIRGVPDDGDECDKERERKKERMIKCVTGNEETRVRERADYLVEEETPRASPVAHPRLPHGG